MANENTTPRAKPLTLTRAQVKQGTRDGRWSRGTEAELLQLTDERDALLAERDDLTARLNGAEQMAAALRVERDAARAAVPWDRTPNMPDVPVTQERYDALCAEEGRLEERAVRLAADLATEKARGDAAEAALAEYAVVERERDQLLEDNSFIASERDASRSNAVDRGKLLEEVRSDLDATRAELSEASAELDAARAELSLATATADTLATRVERLLADLATEKARADAAEAARDGLMRWWNDGGAPLDQMHRLEDDNAKLRAGIRDVEAANSNCHARIVTTEAERDELRATLAKSMASRIAEKAEQATIERERDAARAENATLRDEVARLKAESRLADDVVYADSVSLDTLRGEVERLTAEAEPKALHEASFAAHGALGWGFDPNTVSPVSLARVTEALAAEHMKTLAERDLAAAQLDEAHRQRDACAGEAASFRSLLETAPDWGTSHEGMMTWRIRVIKALSAPASEAWLAEARRAALEEAADHAEDWTCPNCDADTAQDLATVLRALAPPAPAKADGGGE